MKTPEEREQERIENEKMAHERVAETRRQFEMNREGNLVRKIAHLRHHGMNPQADLLVKDLAAWRKR